MFGRKRLKKNNDILFKRNTELNRICIMLQNSLKERDNRISELLETNKSISDELMITSEFYEDKKRECKRLKQLLTRNNIEYRKEN